MTGSRLLLVAIFVLADLISVVDLQAQRGEVEAQVAARGISYVIDQFHRDDVLASDAVTVLDPMLINDQLVAQRVADPDRAAKIGKLIEVQVGSLEDYRTCADTIS